MVPGVVPGKTIRWGRVRASSAALVAVAGEAHRYPEGGSPELREALAAHQSQQDWLDVSQGMNSYIQAGEEVSRMLGRLSKIFKFAEGWRRHLHFGFSLEEMDPLKDALGKNYLVNQKYERALEKEK